MSTDPRTETKTVSNKKFKRDADSQGGYRAA